jgi:hypothetical protein
MTNMRIPKQPHVHQFDPLICQICRADRFVQQVACWTACLHTVEERSGWDAEFAIMVQVAAVLAAAVFLFPENSLESVHCNEGIMYCLSQ